MFDAQTYLFDLRHPDPFKRLQAAQLFGLVRETNALRPLQGAFLQEKDATTKRAQNWAGERLSAALHANDSTFNRLYTRYRLGAGIISEDERREQQLLESMELRMSLDTQQSQLKSSQRTAIMGAALGGVGGAMRGIMSGSDTSLSKTGGYEKRPEPITPPKPTEMDFSIWLKRLSAAQTPQQRQQFVRQIAEVNNLDSLPVLCDLYFSEEEGETKALIEKVAETLYLTYIYWEMHAQGTLEAAITARHAQIGG